MGGGLELALACDLRVAGSSAIMGLTETSLAIIPGAGGTQRLPRAIGLPRAKLLVFTAKRLNAEEAERIGLVQAVAGSGKTALDEAMIIAAAIAKNGPVALRMAKQAMNKGMQTDVATGMAIEQLCYAGIIKTEDRLEGLKVGWRSRSLPASVAFLVVFLVQTLTLNPSLVLNCAHASSRRSRKSARLCIRASDARHSLEALGASRKLPLR
jgi:1,4-dihydroxy-2-naphthoyl-CoA synthase